MYTIITDNKSSAAIKNGLFVTQLKTMLFKSINAHNIDKLTETQLESILQIYNNIARINNAGMINMQQYEIKNITNEQGCFDIATFETSIQQQNIDKKQRKAEETLEREAQQETEKEEAKSTFNRESDSTKVCTLILNKDDTEKIKQYTGWLFPNDAQKLLENAFYKDYLGKLSSLEGGTVEQCNYLRGIFASHAQPETMKNMVMVYAIANDSKNNFSKVDSLYNGDDQYEAVKALMSKLSPERLAKIAANPEKVIGTKWYERMFPCMKTAKIKAALNEMKVNPDSKKWQTLIDAQQKLSVSKKKELH